MINLYIANIEGEGGSSAIIDLDGEVVGISIIDYASRYAPIQLVLDNIKQYTNLKILT